MKVTILGCGLRTPLLLSALLEEAPAPEEISLFDLEHQRSELMASLGEAIHPGHGTALLAPRRAEEAIEGADFVISSVRVGGMEQRAADERRAVELGYVGQETTGPAGFAMAVRTIPVAVGYARLIERLSPRAWMINLTNPASIITEAELRHSKVRAVGVCDTPDELMHRLSIAFQAPRSDLRCEYFGLNHLGWVRKVEVAGVDRTAELLADEDKLNALYPAPLFSAEMIQTLGLIPTEYLYFYYRPRQALANQRIAGRTRGEELVQMNNDLYGRMMARAAGKDFGTVLEVYTDYLNRRNASYLKLEGEAGSALEGEAPDWHPFEADTGYHRIAVAAVRALSGRVPEQRMILDVANQGSIECLESDDVVEVGCVIQNGAVTADRIGPVPERVRGLLHATKAYERATVKAAVTGANHLDLAWALAQNPLVGDWDAAVEYVAELSAVKSHHQGF